MLYILCMPYITYAHILNMYALLLLPPGNVQVMRLSIDRMRSGLVDILYPGYAQTRFSYARCGGCRYVPRGGKIFSPDFYNTETCTSRGKNEKPWFLLPVVSAGKGLLQ